VHVEVGAARGPGKTRARAVLGILGVERVPSRALVGRRARGLRGLRLRLGARAGWRLRASDVTRASRVCRVTSAETRKPYVKSESPRETVDRLSGACARRGKAKSGLDF